MSLMMMQAEPTGSGMQRIRDILEAPIPEMSLWMVLVLLFVLWLLFRQSRSRASDLGANAEKVLRERYASGEIGEETYKKMLNDVRLRPKY